MSAVAEAPPQEVTPPEAPAPSTPLGSLLSSMKVIRENGVVEVSTSDKPPEEQKPAPETPEEVKPPVEKEPEKPKEPAEKPPEKPAEEQKEIKDLGLSEKASVKFKKLEASRDEAVKERDKLNAELQEIRTKLQETEQKAIQANPEEVQQYVSQIEQANKVIADLRAELRAGSIERDPEFVERFIKSKDKRLADIKGLALAAGATEADFQRAVKFQDEDQLLEWRNALKPAQQRQWDARMLEVEQIEYQRQEAIENSQKTWQEMQTRRQESMQQQHQQLVQQNMKLANDVVDGIWKQVPGLEEQKEVKGEVTKLLQGLAGGEGAENWTPDTIMRTVAFAHLQGRALEAQTNVIEAKAKQLEELTKERDELKKKTEEQDQFIREMSGGTPRSESHGSNGGERPTGSLLSSVRVVVPNA